MEVFQSIDDAIHAICKGQVSVLRRTPVSGGDINDAFRLTLSDESEVFLKSNRREKLDFFRAEADGLTAIASAGVISTPEVLAMGTDGEHAFLLLSFLRAGVKRPDFFEDFGHRMASLHASDTTAFTAGGRFGFSRDNYIGASPQYNTPAMSWIDFFAECRLRPQFENAASFFEPEERRAFEGLLSHLDQYLSEPEKPSLLHGDLWGGNYMVGPDGAAWLIDPAVSVGHAEADLAMTELFGGFPQEFYAAYQEVHPIDPGYRERKQLYNLYHLLNHLNLFGGSYLPSVRGILKKYA